MITIKDYYYEPSSSIIAQGNDRAIRAYENQGYYVKSGGYGTYRMFKPSTTRVSFTTEDGKCHTQSVKQLIRDCFGVQRVTRKKLEDFVLACNLGMFDLKYSAESGLYV